MDKQCGKDKDMERLLVLEDGSVYRGQAFGSDNFRIGELVFNTSMTGYQEILTDNAYCGQIVMMTYPLIGNYGINRDDYESIDSSIFGFIVKDYCDEPSNWRSKETLDSFLKREGIPGIYDIDTRAITRKIRNNGTMKATLCDIDANIEEVVATLQSAQPLKNQVETVSSTKVFPIPNRGKKVVVVDFGTKLSTLRELSEMGLDLIVVPHDASVDTIMSFHPDGVILSQGPGNPEDLKDQVETVKELMRKTVVFGMGLGHQLIALACGARIDKMGFGHHGANIPVTYLETNKVWITHQNHGYTVNIDSLKYTKLSMTFQALNDKSCEGIEHSEYPCFGVQFDPEKDQGLYEKFIEMIEKGDHHA